MDVFTIRVIAAAIILALLIYQARQASPGSHRRRAFMLASAGLGCFLVINGMIVFGVNPGLLSGPMVTLGIVLLAASIVFLVLAWRKGELREQIQRMNRAINEERTRREE